MTDSANRRYWFKQTALALAGLSISPALLATAGKANNGTGIWLDSNENAYGPSPLARKAILETYLQSNRYPDKNIESLKQKIAAHWKVTEANILMGAGSSEIIGLACVHTATEKSNIVTAEPSYRVWNNQAIAFGHNFIRVPLDADKKTDLHAMLQAIDSHTRMVYICNPNNPVGTHCTVKDLEDFATEASKKVLVFIDEAYTEYAGLASLAPFAVNNKNIVVAKTFSKIYGLAGARAGYAIAHPQTIEAFSNYQPWSDGAISAVTVAAAAASLDDQAFVADCRQKIKASREECYTAFKQLSLEYIPSQTNFILFNIDRIKNGFTEKMKTRSIHVQYRDHFNGSWCRVSIGTTDEMHMFIKALKEIAG